MELETTEPAIHRGPGETILVVEDDPSVRSLLIDVLTSEGYHVREAANGFEALRVCAESGVRFDLLVLDVILPDTDGVNLARTLAPLQPPAKVLHISGHLGRAVLPPDAHFLQKPFRPHVLLAKVREVLGTGAV